MKKNLFQANKIIVGFIFFILALFYCQSGLVFARPFQGEGQGEVIEALRFQETDIRTVIRSIAAQAYRNGRKVNIVIGPEVTGLVSIELEDVSWQDALRVVLRAHNYSYEWVGDHMILVATLEEIADRRQKEASSEKVEALTTEIFRFSFGKVEELREAIEDLVTARGSATIDKRTNTLIVSDTHSNLENIRDFARELDTITPQVLIEAKIIETNFDAEADLGVKWDLSLKAESKAGTYGWSSIPDAFTLGTLDASEVGAALDFILTDTETKILSQPKIMTMDNSPASIRVVTEEPVPRYNYNTDTGMWEIAGFDYKAYGVVLDVTPQINKDGFVTLKIEPEVSDLIDDKDFSSAGQTVRIPIIETRMASTQVMIKDGETLVIGGLIKDRETDVISKIPVLGDLPFLGWFFKNKDRKEKKVNLLVFITPRIMTPEAEVLDISKVREEK